MILTILSRLTTLAIIVSPVAATWQLRANIIELKPPWWLSVWLASLIVLGFAAQQWLWPARRSAWLTLYCRIAIVAAVTSLGLAGYSMVDFVSPAMLVPAVGYMVASALTFGLMLHCMMHHRQNKVRANHPFPIALPD